MPSFSDFGLIPTLEKTLKGNKFTKPTEIQLNVIPLMMGGQSVVGVSETGSGKTFAFALPLLSKIKELENQGNVIKASSTPRAIVMTPTRELGEQVAKVFKTFTHDTRLRVRPALGGMPFEQVRRNIGGPFEILIATPGQLVKIMDRNLIDLSEVRFLVFDEADQMLDDGFLPNSNLIVASCTKDLQMALFSATVSEQVQKLITSLFSKAEFIRTAGSGHTVDTLTTQNCIVKDGKRWPIFETILNKKITGGTMIFTNTREQCDKLATEMTAKGFKNLVYRGEMDKLERRQNLKKFRDGEIGFLISTDLAGRGLDLENVNRVINYHLPKQMENYLHRAGRTARAGRPGLVVNLITERDEPLMAHLAVKRKKTSQK